MTKYHVRCSSLIVSNLEFSIEKSMFKTSQVIALCSFAIHYSQHLEVQGQGSQLMLRDNL